MSDTKKIVITGKQNIDRLTKKKNKRIRCMAQEKDYSYKDECNIITCLVNNDVSKSIFIETKKEIERKISGYRQQDQKKQIFDKNKLISLLETLLKLDKCKLKCYYCKERVKILYRIVRDPKQWTLDRIDNNLGHNYDNVVVCCLECNVKRGDMDSERFKRGKEIKIVRKLF